ncbi:MAG: TRAP transporter substrate-binding protein DctP [Betaproteobacteria bacterium]|nr:TRAP transporter substrate-binding protein DctP [Betaproteobacteria bacterium]
MSWSKIGLLSIIAIVSVPGDTSAEPISLPVFTGGTITEAAEKAIAFISDQSKRAEGTSLRLTKSRVSTPDFCRNLREEVNGLYISSLSGYRQCYKEQQELGALDFPFLANDWGRARQLLNGPMGLAVAESFSKRGVHVLNFWDGDIRVFSSKTRIASAKDFKGKKVVAPPTFASSTAIAQSGGTRVPLPFAEIVPALDRGLADAADVPLTFFSRELTDVHKSVLLSNHSLDPFVIAAPIKTIESLLPWQRGFLESIVRQSTAYQIREAQASLTKSLSYLKDRGVTVAPLTGDAAVSFRTVRLAEVSSQNAQVVFARAAPSIRAAAVLQAQGETLVPYWKVFFVTNRTVVKKTFSTGYSTNLSYGQADIEFDFDGPLNMPAELQQGVLQGLVRFGKKGSGISVDWARTSPTPFPDGFARVPPAMPAKAPLLYVHGFANTFDDALRRAAWTGWNAKRPVVAFAWASQGKGTPGDYRIDQETADKSREMLALLLDRLGHEYDTRTDVDIVVHSMGARLTLGALEALDNKNVPGKALKFRQLVLVAPDVASESLKKSWKSLIKYFENKATLYISDHDLALGISREFMNPDEGPRAGLAPPVLIADNIESIFIGPNDFSFTGHSYHVANGVIADDIFEVLRYGTRAQERRGSGLSPSGQGYYELRRLENP